MKCPGCETTLVEVPAVEGLRPHLFCPGCKLVYVFHEECQNQHLRGFHICHEPAEHLKAKPNEAVA